MPDSTPFKDLNPVHVSKGEITAGDYVIAVMGPTGAGKSTFIATATGRDFGVGHGLESQTSQMTAVRVKRGGDSVVLIDTPGFNDTYLSDYDILKIIFDWLLEKSGSSQKSLTLCGILYLHRISDNRMGGTLIKNLQMFQKLIGKDRFDKILLTTTMWPDDESDLQDAVKRENELCDDYWKFMIGKGSRTLRFEGTQDAAWSILDSLVKREKLSIQSQTTDQNTKDGQWPSQHLNPVRVVKEEITADDRVIAIMGPTRTGKSTFIAAATGRDFGVSHGLQSHTSQMTAVRVKRGEDHVVLVDTPGFDNTYLSDYDVLKRISHWLRQPSDGPPNSLKLCGILYLHRISDIRMRGTVIKNLEMFQKLCGENRFDRVLLTTTMWPDDPSDLQDAVEREKELCCDYWKLMIQQGSRAVRFEGTQDSAWSILDSLVKREKHSIQIQKELSKPWKNVPDTAAGKLFRDMNGPTITRRENAQRLLLEETGKTTDEEVRDELVREWLSLREEEEKAARDQQRLNSFVGRRLIRIFTYKSKHPVAQFPYEDRCRDLVSDILKNDEQRGRVPHLSGDNAVKMYDFLTLISHNKESMDERLATLRHDLSLTISSDGKQPACEFIQRLGADDPLMSLEHLAKVCHRLMSLVLKSDLQKYIRFF